MTGSGGKPHAAAGGVSANHETENTFNLSLLLATRQSQKENNVGEQLRTKHDGQIMAKILRAMIPSVVCCQIRKSATIFLD